MSGGAAAGAGGSSSSGGAGARDPVARWIDPDLLETKCEYVVCIVCAGVMVEPTIGCPGLHSLCGRCYGKALRKKKECPVCRFPVANEQKLVRNRDLEGVISQLWMRCEHAKGEGPRVAKRAKPVDAASLTVEALRGELLQRGLETEGKKPELVARLEEDRKTGGGCTWRGFGGGLAAHLGECPWAPVKCPYKGCTESPLRRDLPGHEATCEHRVIKCSHCRSEVAYRSLAEHEGCCPWAEIECPNEGCVVKYKRGVMNLHRAECEHEEVACLCPGCDARLPRKDMDAHVEATHLQSAAKELQRAWGEVAKLKALSKSELHHAAAATPTTWVFNWPAAGWGPGTFKSETRRFGDKVTANCVIIPSSRPEHSHFIGLRLPGGGKCRVHAKFSILDKHDKTLREILEIGTATAPAEHHSSDGGSMCRGKAFTPTAEEKAASVRADGSIRLRVVVRLFLDGAEEARRRRRWGGLRGGSGELNGE